MPDQIVLYDLPCKGRCACWSPNVWKTRMVLNYKELPYHTEWVQHPDITPKFEGLGIAPHKDAVPGKSSAYTVPAIQLPDGAGVMDSAAIASKLEALHPDPPLHLDNGLPGKLGPILGKIMPPIIPVFMPRIGRDMIHEDSYEWFQEARAKRFGMPLDDLEKAKGGDRAWEAAQPGIVELTEFIKGQKQDSGPYILGSQVCYADFVIASLLEALRRIGDDLYERMMKLSGDDTLRQLHEGCQKWMKDDQ